MDDVAIALSLVPGSPILQTRRSHYSCSVRKPILMMALFWACGSLAQEEGTPPPASIFDWNMDEPARRAKQLREQEEQARQKEYARREQEQLKKDQKKRESQRRREEEMQAQQHRSDQMRLARQQRSLDMQQLQLARQKEKLDIQQQQQALVENARQQNRQTQASVEERQAARCLSSLDCRAAERRRQAEQHARVDQDESAPPSTSPAKKKSVKKPGTR
jgi:hypothetical protein